MKIRTSHVTNSSSTSYIVGLKSKTPSTISTIAELNARHRNDTPEEYVEIEGEFDYSYGYHEMKELIEKGYHVIKIDVDNYGVDMEKLVTKLIPNAWVEMLPI